MARPPTSFFLDTLVSVARGWQLLPLASENGLQGLSLLGQSAVAVCLCNQSLAQSFQGVLLGGVLEILSMPFDLPPSYRMVTGSIAP